MENGVPLRCGEFPPYDPYVGGKLVKRAVTDHVGKVYYGGFAHCGSIRGVVIADKVKTIEEDAFYAARVRRVTVGKNLKRICDGAFDRRPELKTVYYRGSKEEWKKIKIGVRSDALPNARIVYNHKDGGKT